MQRREVFEALNKENSVSSFDEVDFDNNNQFLDKRLTGLSKSVENLKNNNNNNNNIHVMNENAEFIERKSINSAPSLNEIIDSSKYKNFDDTPVSALSKASLLSNGTEMSVDNYSGIKSYIKFAKHCFKFKNIPKSCKNNY